MARSTGRNPSTRKRLHVVPASNARKVKARDVKILEVKALDVGVRGSSRSAEAGQVILNATERQAREELIATALAMSRTGLSPGRSGNVSRRWVHAAAGAGMLITPSGVAYEEIKAEDVVFVAENGSVPDGQLKPSSEWRFHLSAYAARPDRYAIVHTHSMNAVVLASAGLSIPAFHYMVAIAGTAEIPCVPYATFGTGKLARYVARGLKRADACLMANHGQIALGKTLAQALELAREVEILSEQYAKVLMLGRPRLLNEKQMRKVLARFQSYGQHAQSDAAKGAKRKAKDAKDSKRKAKQKS